MLGYEYARVVNLPLSITSTSTGVENRVRLILMRMHVGYGTELGSNRRENCSSTHLLSSVACLTTHGINYILF